MVRTGLKVGLADAVLLSAFYFVIQDLQWRSAYASSNGFTPSNSYSLLTRFFSIARGGLALASPPTLDWVQVIVATLLVLNAWFFIRMFRLRSARSP